MNFVLNSLLSIFLMIVGMIIIFTCVLLLLISDEDNTKPRQHARRWTLAYIIFLPIILVDLILLARNNVRLMVGVLLGLLLCLAGFSLLHI